MPDHARMPPAAIIATGRPGTPLVAIGSGSALDGAGHLGRSRPEPALLGKEVAECRADKQWHRITLDVIHLGLPSPGADAARIAVGRDDPVGQLVNRGRG